MIPPKNGKLVTQPCVKCGHLSASLNWGLDIRRGQIADPESMRATCDRCGFGWTETPLDETSNVEET